MGSGLSSRQPLLQKRTSRRSQSLSSPQERDTVRRSVLAWHDDQDIRDRSELVLSWRVLGTPREFGKRLGN